MSDRFVQEKIVYVDSPDAVRRALSEGEVPCGLISDNPLLVHTPNLGVRLQDLSQSLSQGFATRLGESAVDALLLLDRRLNSEGAVERFGGLPAPLNVTMALRALLSTLLLRGYMIKAGLAADKSIPLEFYCADLSRWDSTNPWNLGRFSSPFHALAIHGFFDPRPVRFTTVPVQLPDSPNETVVDDLALRAMVPTSPQLLHELGQMIGLGWLGWRRGLVVGKSAEILRETLPWLAMRGHRFGRFAAPLYQANTLASGDKADTSPDPWLQEIATPVLEAELCSLGVFSRTEIVAIVAVVMAHLDAGMQSLAPTRAALASALDCAFNRGSVGKRRKGQALLTSGFYGPIAGQLIAECRKRGVVLIDFEHGATTGLAWTSERRLSVSEARTCDHLIVSSGAAAVSFGKAQENGTPSIAIVGLPDQTRGTSWRRLQRARARRKLGLRRGERAVMHVSTLLYGGNMRPGDDSPVESYVFQTERQLLTGVYGQVPATVLFKTYPTQRLPYQPDYDLLFDLPPNVRLMHAADFRYFRSAADIIVTTANSSTIGWCVGVGVPLVHLGSRHVHALRDDLLRAEFAAAFFTVDLDQSDWPDRLIAILSTDPGELREAWLEKQAAREALLRSSVIGPSGSAGRRAAAVVLKALA